MKLKRLCSFLSLLLLCIFFLNACSGGGEEAKLSDLDFTVISNENIQPDIQKLIDEKKENPFQMTYSDGNYKYIVIGYGKQETGGYSIQVKEVYDTENTICVKTALLGPTTEDEKMKSPSYPYIVIKIQNVDKTVTFG